MEILIMVVGFGLVIVGLAVLAVGEAYIIRTAREISAIAADVAAIQRAIFLQLRRQYGDIDQDLKELRDLLQEQKG